MAPTFTDDWFSQNIPLWKGLFGPLAGSPLAYLEIGSYQGRSACWMLDNVLTHPDSRAHCVDTWEGSVEHTEDQKRDLYPVFCGNMEPYGDRVVPHKGRSESVLKALAPAHAQHFDVIYIDGDHHSSAALEDAVLAFPLLKPGGILVFDDYAGGRTHELSSPQRGINAFVNVYSDKLRVVHVGYQLVAQKNPSA